jgi:hypothetical protein
MAIVRMFPRRSVSFPPTRPRSPIDIFQQLAIESPADLQALAGMAAAILASLPRPQPVRAAVRSPQPIPARRR